MDVIIVLLMFGAAYVCYRKLWPTLEARRSEMLANSEWVRRFALYYLAVEMSYSVSEIPDSIRNAYKGIIRPSDRHSILVRLDTYLNYNMHRIKTDFDYKESVREIISLARTLVDRVCKPLAPRDYIRAVFYKEKGTEIEEAEVDLQIRDMERAIKENPLFAAKLQQVFLKELVERTFAEVHGLSIWDYQKLISPQDI